MPPTDATGARRPSASRTLALPAIAVVALPKCPMCVMLALSALGLGHALHERVFASLQGAALALVVALLILRHRRAPMRIALGLAAAGAVVLGLAGLTPAGMGYGGALLLAAAWLWKPAEAAPACGCAP
jgi:hypothetical protein